MPAARPSDLVPAVLSLAGTFLRESERLFRPHGISAAQYNVLAALAPHPEGISQRELSEVLVVDRSNVTGLINRLEKAGWVRRKDDPRDRRVYRVVLTAEGRDLWERLAIVYDRAVEAITRGLTRRDAQQALEVLSALERRSASWR